MKRKREGKDTQTATQTSSTRDDGLGRGYEVFLSFRGPDARLTIADTLYNDLNLAGIRAFKDNEELRFGEEIEGGLLQAINESIIYIPILSKNYASSKWCLRELAHIVELSRDNDEKVILPIFYDVDADDVKLKSKLYRKALRKHKSESGKDLARRWKKALREVGRISGRKLKDHGLHKLNSLTVKEVSSRLWTRRTYVPDHLVGIEEPKDDILKKLDLGSSDARYVVIHGMGGIGKTTLANAVFKQISSQFQDRCCFLKDVRTSNILNLQKKLLLDLLNVRCTDLSDTEMADWIKTRFHGKKVLIVLDDIDRWDQLMTLAGELNWFGDGSRIIITTRNIEFFVKESEDGNVSTSNSRQFSFYDMPMMNSCDALQLFSERAWGCTEPPPNYMDISNEFISVLGRLPLALDVVGSTLREKSRSTWEDLLCKLNKVMNNDVKNKLMISYKALERNQQQIYLDIACFFNHQGKTTAIKYWDAVFGYPTEIEVKTLAHMSLIKIINNDELWMHDQLRDLGREIVDVESHEIHLRGSRLWSPKDAFHALQRKKGTKNIVGLNLATPKPDVTYRFKHKEFSRLVKLRFLQLDHGNFEGDFKNLFFELRWLSWSNCPSEFQATNLGLENLAILELCRSNITEKWGGWSQIMVAKQLKVLILMDCPALRKTPEFSSISGLERLILRRCIGLRKIDKSIGNLQHLDHLVIECKAIRSLPKSIGCIKSLTELRVSSDRLSILPDSIVNLVKLKHLILSCPELQELPDSIGQLESLFELDVGYTRIRELPYSMGNIEMLKVLKIHGWQLERLPDSIGRLKSLVELDVSSSSVKILPDYIGDLKKLKILNLCESNISELPKSIGMLENLEELYVQCRYLEGEIPSEIGALSSLKILHLLGGRFRGLPTTINQLTNLQRLNLLNCRCIQQLPKLPTSLTGLSFSWDLLTTIPDLSNLSHLVVLRIYGTPILEEPGIKGLERLCTLRVLTLRVGRRALPPTDLSSLSQLQRLTVKYSRYLISLPSSLQDLTLTDVQSPIDWSLFSNLENLSKLCIQRYSLGEIRFEVLGKLRKFNELRMYHCPSLKTLSVLPCLKEIRSLHLQELPRLTEIHGLGELKSLQYLSIYFCKSIKSLNESNLSDLQNLKRLDFSSCKSLERVPGMPKSCQLFEYNCPRLNKDE